MEPEKTVKDGGLPSEGNAGAEALATNPPEPMSEAEDSPRHEKDENMTGLVKIPEVGEKHLSLGDFPLAKKGISMATAAGLQLIANTLAIADPEFNLSSTENDKSDQSLRKALLQWTHYEGRPDDTVVVDDERPYSGEQVRKRIAEHLSRSSWDNIKQIGTILAIPSTPRHSLVPALESPVQETQGDFRLVVTNRSVIENNILWFLLSPKTQEDLAVVNLRKTDFTVSRFSTRSATAPKSDVVAVRRLGRSWKVDKYQNALVATSTLSLDDKETGLEAEGVKQRPRKPYGFKWTQSNQPGKITTKNLLRLIPSTPTLDDKTAQLVCAYLREMKTSELYLEMKTRTFPIQLSDKKTYYLQIKPETKSWHILAEDISSTTSTSATPATSSSAANHATKNRPTRNPLPEKKKEKAREEMPVSHHLRRLLDGNWSSAGTMPIAAKVVAIKTPQDLW